MPTIEVLSAQLKHAKINIFLTKRFLNITFIREGKNNTQRFETNTPKL